MIPSFGIRISSEFENMNIDMDEIAEFKPPEVLPWTFSQPRVFFYCIVTKNLKLILLFFEPNFMSLSDFPNNETIFTDDSNDGEIAGSACVIHLLQINVEYLTMALIFQRKSKLLI